MPPAATAADGTTYRLLDGVRVDGVAEDDVFMSSGAHEHCARPVHARVRSIVEPNLASLQHPRPPS